MYVNMVVIRKLNINLKMENGVVVKDIIPNEEEINKLLRKI